MSWDPTIYVEDWGRPRLVIGGTDVTFYRDVPVQIRGWDNTEPFGDGTLTVGFPQITPFEALPSWATNFASVDLELVRPNGTRKKLFEGLWVTEEDSLSAESNGLEFVIAGAFYQVDFYRKSPEMQRYPNGRNDIMLLIQSQFDPALRPALRTMPLLVPGWSGVTYAQKGAWNQALTGYVQDLLAIGTNSGLPQAGEPIVGITSNPGGGGYWLVGSRGSVLAFGAARYYGSMVGTQLSEPASGIAAHPTEGYWFGARDGGVFTFGYVPQFFGSLGATGTPTDVVGIEAMPDGLGYIMAAEDGSIYNFGSSTYHGGFTPLGGDVVVDVALTPSGHGYWVVTKLGYVYAQGDATYYGGNGGDGKTYVAMAARPQGDGYWLLASDGTIREHGAAAAYAAIAPSIAAADLAATASGAGLWLVDEIGGVFTKGDATYHGSTQDGGGNESQWTIGQNPGRQPILRIKDTWTTHWTVTCGTPGVEHDFTRDFTMAPNAYYGEGVDVDGCMWRNSRYPNYQPETAPIFAGTTLVVGADNAEVRKWKQQMFDSGWADVAVSTKFTTKDSNIARLFQHLAGLAETGTVNAQTWNATFQVGSLAGNFDSPYFAPLAEISQVEPFLFNPRGDRIGFNPSFDAGVVRVETYDNYGSQVSKQEGGVSAWARLNRDYPADYVGEIILTIDPQEGSRFEMRAGENISFKSYRGRDLLFHIAKVDVAWEEGRVTLTVDQHARDMMTLAAVRQRNREASDPAGRQRMVYRNSRQVEDRKVVWDCESGAGIVPRHAVNAGLWSVLRIPCGESGQVVSTQFTLDTPAQFSVGIFDRPVTHALLTSIWDNPLDPTYWDDLPETGVDWTSLGLIMAWGGAGQAAGYSPGLESDGDTLTGVLKDDAAWYFEASQPPWLWVAMWVESPSINYISGRLIPGALT